MFNVNISCNNQKTLFATYACNIWTWNAWLPWCLLIIHDDHDQGFIKFVTPKVLQLMINTLTKSVYRLNHSKKNRDPDEQYKQLLTWIRSWLPEKSWRQAQVELGSTKVQAIERAPTGRQPLNSSLTLYLTIIYETRSYGGLIFSW
jgi:hypothetical protein